MFMICYHTESEEPTLNEDCIISTSLFGTVVMFIGW